MEEKYFNLVKKFLKEKIRPGLTSGEIFRMIDFAEWLDKRTDPRTPAQADLDEWQAETDATRESDRPQ